jgi:membrane protein
MVFGVGFLLLVSLVISATLSGFGKYMGRILPLPLFLLEAINIVISFAVIALLFALIYKVLPDVEIAWRDVWIGAAITSLLFTIGKFAIGLYLGRSTVGNAYGAAGSLVVILIWIYYSAQILFFGAELTQVYANTFGSRIRPVGNALPVTKQARAQHEMSVG